MGSQSGMQFLGQNRAIWQDRSLWDKKVLSGENIGQSGRSISYTLLELRTQDSCLFILPWYGQGSWAERLSPAYQAAVMLQGFQNEALNYMITHKAPAFPLLIPCHKPTHTHTSGCSRPLQLPDAAHPRTYPSYSQLKLSSCTKAAFTAPCARICLAEHSMH